MYQWNSVPRPGELVAHPHVLASSSASHGLPSAIANTLAHTPCAQELAAGRDMFWLWWETRPSRCLTEDRARFFASQLLDAMAYLQSVGICHRDLKLQNLLLDADQHTLKLSDFGTAVFVRFANLLVRRGDSREKERYTRRHTQAHSRTHSLTHSLTHPAQDPFPHHATPKYSRHPYLKRLPKLQRQFLEGRAYKASKNHTRAHTHPLTCTHNNQTYA